MTATPGWVGIRGEPIPLSHWVVLGGTPKVHCGGPTRSSLSIPSPPSVDTNSARTISSASGPSIPPICSTLPVRSKFHIQTVGATADLSLKDRILTVIVSVTVYFFRLRLSHGCQVFTSEEKGYVTKQLLEDSDAAQDERSWHGVIQAFKVPKVWLYCLCFHTVNFPVNTLGFFLPTIIHELGYTAAQAQLLSVPTPLLLF